MRPYISLDNSNLVGHIQGVIIRCQPDIGLLGSIRPATEKLKFRRNGICCKFECKFFINLLFHLPCYTYLGLYYTLSIKYIQFNACPISMLPCAQHEPFVTPACHKPKSTKHVCLSIINVWKENCNIKFTASIPLSLENSNNESTNKFYKHHFIKAHLIKVFTFLA